MFEGRRLFTPSRPNLAPPLVASRLAARDGANERWSGGSQLGRRDSTSLFGGNCAEPSILGPRNDRHLSRWMIQRLAGRPPATGPCIWHGANCDVMFPNVWFSVFGVLYRARPSLSPEISRAARRRVLSKVRPWARWTYIPLCARQTAFVRGSRASTHLIHIRCVVTYSYISPLCRARRYRGTALS